jgi:hypothetical protein
MVHCLQSRNAFVWVEGNKTSKKVDFQFVESRSMITHGHAAEFGEGGFEVSKLESIWPVSFVGRAEDLEYFEDLVNLTVSHKKWLSLDHLCEDATGRPQVDTERVGFLSKQDFRATVPKSDDFMRVSFNREAESSRQTEVRKFDCQTISIHK